MQIQRLALNMFATLASGTFRNSPLAFRTGKFVDNTFSADNLTCTMSRRGAVTKELVSDSAPSSYHYQYHCVCDPRCTSTSQCYQRHALLENGAPAYQIYVGRRPTIKCWYAAQPAGCTDATRSLTRPRLRSHPGWAVTRLTVRQ